jgi:hypothetical protein
MSGVVNAFVCSPNYRRGVLFIAFYGLALRPVPYHTGRST